MMDILKPVVWVFTTLAGFWIFLQLCVTWLEIDMGAVFVCMIFGILAFLFSVLAAIVIND